jgi:DNA polymerase III subunit beta
LAIGTNHVRAQIGDVRFTSKLIDGRFPEYSRVIPAAPAGAIKGDRDLLRQALQRTSILVEREISRDPDHREKEFDHGAGA